MGKVVFIFVLGQNNTDNVITIDANKNMIQLVGGELRIGFCRLDITNSNTKLTATSTNFIGPNTTLNMQPKTSFSIYGFLFTI